MKSFLIESVLILPCFGAAFALSKLMDRLMKRRMPHIVRGMFTLGIGMAFLYVAAISLFLLVCRFSACEI